MKDSDPIITWYEIVGASILVFIFYFCYVKRMTIMNEDDDEDEVGSAVILQSPLRSDVPFAVEAPQPSNSNEVAIAVVVEDDDSVD